MSEKPALLIETTQKDELLDDLKLKYIRTKMYLESIEIQRKYYDSTHYSIKIALYYFSIGLSIITIILGVLTLPIESACGISFCASFPLILALIMIFGLKLGKREFHNMRNDIIEELKDYKKRIFDILEEDSPFPITNRMKQKYLSNIDIKTEIRKKFKEHCKESIMIDFYNIPDCFSMYRDIIYEAEI